MKATIASEKSYPGMVYDPSTKITKKSTKIDENEAIRSYLTKLKRLVPFMPRDRKLSKLEVIQHVIDYICDLQYALEMHPNINSAAVQSAAAVMLCSGTQPSTSRPIVAPLHRKPLGVLPPNANVAVEPSSVSSSRQSEKVSSTTDSKTVSC